MTESPRPQIVSVNVSEERSAIKRPVTEIIVTETGIVGDAHAGKTGRSISLLARESIEQFAKEVGREISWGEFGENLTTQGLDSKEVAMLDRLRIGDVELEVTQLGTKHHGKTCAIYKEVGRCVMPTEGIFGRVTRGGKVTPGEEFEHLPKRLLFKIITLSDRASRGEYEDRSGPCVMKSIEEYMKDSRWRHDIESVIIPDDPHALRAALSSAETREYDVVITTGGTGVGPRDITPDVVAAECSRLIPGIMENIRVKYGVAKPAALLSRSVAGVLGNGLVYTLPGSVKAVEEYMSEILKTLEHLILMLNGVDAHDH